jgi:histidinol phosphatase-like PHP family hydrolase
MKIEAGKFYLRVENGFVIDAVEYNPERSDFQLYEAPSIPSDILNRCYKLEGGVLTLDTDKHAAFLEETSKDAKIAELEAKIKELESQ